MGLTETTVDVLLFHVYCPVYLHYQCQKSLVASKIVSSVSMVYRLTSECQKLLREFLFFVVCFFLRWGGKSHI